MFKTRVLYAPDVKPPAPVPLGSSSRTIIIGFGPRVKADTVKLEIVALDADTVPVTVTVDAVTLFEKYLYPRMVSVDVLWTTFPSSVSI